ncbi:hypothetical protein NQ314_003519 [Rhamnusium bicolor]|uniref:THAP-type domain-containing protein n=1 Tax=Rhamnusium bicolor TaxID=1586634 RepID=A0AAV8ZM22_9CUCU|nr:hypothetical protein NQ314_003519 [Rhamnusium bicolor]
MQKGKILDIVARWRGWAHDSRIWYECLLKHRFASGEINGILLGDNWYPCSRSKRWLQAMGIKIQTLSGHVRICDQHFGEECFIPYMSDLRLKHDALPTIINRKVPAICSDQETSEPLPNKGNLKPSFCSPSTSALCTSDMHLQPKALPTKLKSPEIPALGAQQQTCEQLPEERLEVIPHEIITAEEGNLKSNFSPPSTSTPKGTRSRRSLFKDVEDTLTTEMSPRKKKLMGIVKKKQGRIRKLQKICKQKGKIIKYLGNIDKSPEVNSIFKGFSERDRMCSLAFDEMAIREHIEYNHSADCIEGLEDYGSGDRTEKLAKYALVFLCRNITKVNETLATPLSDMNSDELAVEIANAVAVGSAETLSVAYVSGFIVKKCLLKFICD